MRAQFYNEAFRSESLSVRSAIRSYRTDYLRSAIDMERVFEDHRNTIANVDQDVNNSAQTQRFEPSTPALSTHIFRAS